MTATDVLVSHTGATVDFTATSTALYVKNHATEADAPDLEEPTTVIGGKRHLWCGNANPNGGYDRLRYLGTQNDRDAILLKVGGADQTAQWFGYATEDCNMDGAVRYIGNDDDREYVLRNLGGSTVTNQRYEQLP